MISVDVLLTTIIAFTLLSFSAGFFRLPYIPKMRSAPFGHQQACQAGLPEDDQWGQSFIGQDVCGSKYNDDPFSEQGSKPSAWDEMKRRIDRIEQMRRGNTTSVEDLNPSYRRDKLNANDSKLDL